MTVLSALVSGAPATEAGAAPVAGVVSARAAQAPPGPGTYTISALHSGKCLGPRDASEYALIVQQPCDGRASQRVTLVPTTGYRSGTYLFRLDSGMCWSVHNGSKENYAAILQRPCQNRWYEWLDLHTDQHPWAGSVIRTNTGGWTDSDRWRVIHVLNASTADDTHLIQYTPHNSWGTGAKNDTFLFHPA
ncbi:RICIN domain-containing protein [Streptomyces sp. NPDC000594]|uniref:RICIN domain-containing protein n=1 Tax=Streptomyces sp. NPDC000594 TaxID=3154261 RepID=UPI00332A87A3